MIVTRARKPARGMTVVAVLVCLLILTLISGAVLKVGHARRELARGHEHRLQAAWLSESGTQRALARLALDSDYKGETWALDARDLGQAEPSPATASPPRPASPAAVVVIAVQGVPGDSHRRRIRVQADYPPDPSRRSRHTKEIMIDLKPSPRGAVP
jgi:Tfp pilus assembly protein PilV